MKSNLKVFWAPCWRILSEVPGWPDAPRRLRIRRLIPIVLPLAAMLILFLWNQAWRLPRLRAERAAHQPLVALEEEVRGLRLSGSDQAASDLRARAIEAAQALLADPKQASEVIEQLGQSTRAQQWTASFSVIPPTSSDQADSALLTFLTVRGKLAPAADNPQPFSSLLGLLEQLCPRGRSIDLTRLSLRADEQGKLLAEIHLRVGCQIRP